VIPSSPHRNPPELVVRPSHRRDRYSRDSLDRRSGCTCVSLVCFQWCSEISSGRTKSCSWCPALAWCRPCHQRSILGIDCHSCPSHRITKEKQKRKDKDKEKKEEERETQVKEKQRNADDFQEETR
jgi:hypothetical protein